MLTDEQIKALRDKANASFALCEVDPRNLDELCTRVLEAEARVKVLEEALNTIVASEQTGWIADLAREALEASLSPLPHNQEL